jgi:hypothetical protein
MCDEVGNDVMSDEVMKVGLGDRGRRVGHVTPITCISFVTSHRILSITRRHQEVVRYAIADVADFFQEGDQILVKTEFEHAIDLAEA